MKKTPLEIETLDEIIARTLFEREFKDLKDALKEQKTTTWGVIIGVVLAFILTVGVILVDSNLARNVRDEGFNSNQKEMNDQRIEINNLNNRIDNLQIRNPYLK